MRVLFLLLTIILLVGCTSANNGTISPLLTTESLYQTRSEDSVESVINVQQFLDFVPGEATMNDVYELLLKTDEDLLHLHPSGWGWRLEVEVDNSRLLTFDCAIDRTVLAINYTLADKDAFITAKKDEELYNDVDRAISDYIPADADQQVADNTPFVGMRSFSTIIPGKSTIEDVYQIAKSSGMKECVKTASKRGWWVEFPAEDGKIISVEMDPSYTVISITYHLKDMSMWIDVNINNK